MKRVSVTIPDELAAAVRAEIPNVNVSGVLQEALRHLLACDHGHLACADCGTLIDAERIGREKANRLYVEICERLEDLLWRAGTLEGGFRVMRDVALRHQLPAGSRPLPRLSRTEREQQARHRHPTSQTNTQTNTERSPRAHVA